MKKIFSFILVAAVCCGCIVSCNEKPKNYRFVKVMTGSEEVNEDISAVNDTDALKQYFDRMEKVIIENLDKPEPKIESMYVISPDGDTLNTNEELLQAVAKTLPIMNKPAPVTPVEPKPQTAPTPPVKK